MAQLAIVVLFLAILADGGEAQSTPTKGPNVVVIFTDDQGWGDVGVYGARGFKTPHLDRMAREGMRFTHFYTAQPVCSAARAALLTGCYSNRVGISGALGPRSRTGLNPEEVTLAEICSSRGYVTGMFGKWHLGHHPKFLPDRQGFDEFAIVPYSNDMWPFHPKVSKLPANLAKRKSGFPDLRLLGHAGVLDERIEPSDQEQFTTMFATKAVDFIRRHSRQRFFLYVAHPMPHVPLFTSDKFAGKSEQGKYGDVISEIDWSVGEILGALKETGVDDNTLVIFTSDNGPWLSYGNHGGSAGPLREGKGTTWEGGVREPCIVRWPGHVPAGTICSEPAMTIDLLPTVAGLVGAALPPKPIDGLDIWPLMSGQKGAQSPHEALYFYYRQNDLEAVRSGRWKLVFPHKYRSLVGEAGRDGSPGGYSQKTCGLELYDVVGDVSESLDVSKKNPEVVRRLEALAEKARVELGDRLTKRKGTGRRPVGRI